MKSVIAWLRRQPVAVGAVVQLGVLIGCRMYGATAHDTVYAVAVALTIVSAVVHQQVTPNPTITAITGSLATLKPAGVAAVEIIPHIDKNAIAKGISDALHAAAEDIAPKDAPTDPPTTPDAPKAP